MIILVIALIYTWCGIIINCILISDNSYVNGVELFFAILIWLPFLIAYPIAKRIRDYRRKKREVNNES